MRQISVVREGNQYNFKADDLALNVAWRPQLEIDFQQEHALGFTTVVARMIERMLVETGLTPEEVTEALTQFNALRAKE